MIALIYGFTGSASSASDRQQTASSQRRGDSLPRRLAQVRGGIAMTAASHRNRGRPPESQKRGFKLPSAYTILFILIVVVAR